MFGAAVEVLPLVPEVVVLELVIGLAREALTAPMMPEFGFGYPTEPFM